MIKFIKKYAQLSPEEEKALSASFSKANRVRIKKNIDYLMSTFQPLYQHSKLTEKEKSIRFSKKIALLLKNHPTLFLCDPNPKNNGSIASKIEFYQKYMDVKPYQLTFFHADLLTVDTYENSNAENMLLYFQDVLEFDRKELYQVFTKYPPLIKQPCDDEFNKKVMFWQDIADYARVSLNDFFVRNIHLISHSVDPNEPNSAPAKFEYFMNRFGLTPEDLSFQIHQFSNFFGLDINPDKPRSVEEKIKMFNEIGLSDQKLSKNLKALGCPKEKIKLRYMLCQNYGISTSTFLNGKFMLHESKLYARGEFLKENWTYPSSLIYATEGQFSIRTKTSIKDLVKKYPLTEAVILKQQEKYNKKSRKPVTLTDEEIKAASSQDESELGE